MNEEINKYLTEAMGLCWHRLFPSAGKTVSCPCDNNRKSMARIVFYTDHKNNDFSTWEGFGKLFEWAKEQRWWIDFILQQNPGVTNFCELLTPEKFATKLYNFLKEVNDE